MMDINEIRQYLPHRYPFLLVDRVEGIFEDKKIVGYKNVSVNEPFFNGHFPGHPVMPGVLILEAMAQIAGILGFNMRGKTPKDGSIYYFAGTEKLRFKKPVVPGDKLELRAEYLTSKRGIWKFHCEAFVDQTLACSAQITCAEKDIAA